MFRIGHSTVTRCETVFCQTTQPARRAHNVQHITLHYITFIVKNAEALQTLYKHNNILQTMETTPNIKA